MAVTGKVMQSSSMWYNETRKKLDHQTFLKAKYCPRLAAASHTHTHTQKNTKKPCDLDLWPMTLKFNRVLEVVEVDVRAKFPQAKCSGFGVMNSLQHSRLSSRISLERIKQSTSEIRRYELRFFSTFDENNRVNFGPLTKNGLNLWPWKSIRFVRYMLIQNFIEVSAAVHELSCVQRKKNPDENITVHRRYHGQWLTYDGPGSVRTEPQTWRTRWSTGWAYISSPTISSSWCAFRSAAATASRTDLKRYRDTASSSSFSVSDPTAWNSLPTAVHSNLSSSSCFCRHLKTELFSRAYGVN